MKLPVFALAGVGAAALAGTAFGASPKSHTMNVSLPDGSVAQIQYVGDVAPKVTITPRRLADAQAPFASLFPSFAGFDRMIEEMNRRTQEMMRQAHETARQPIGAAPYIASYGNLPAGETSTTVVSVSNGGGTCTRTTEVVSHGKGTAPKVTTKIAGQCGAAAAPSSGPVNPA